MEKKDFINKVRGNILSYTEYIEWVKQLVSEGKTSGHKQSEVLAGFTSLNLKRMLRINKTIKLSEEFLYELRNLDGVQDWWIITEAWCGDSAQNLPIIAKIAEESIDKINLKIILRDDNSELMDLYQTDGSRSIPKLISFHDDKEVFTWGPRPIPAQQLLFDWKANPNGKDWDNFEKEIHTWYAKDKGITIQHEFVNKLSCCLSV